MCLVIDSSILVANTYLYSQSPFLDYKEIRKYSNLLLKEITAKDCPVMFSNNNTDSFFSVGECSFIKMGNQILVESFNAEEYQRFLQTVFSQKILDSMNDAGNKYVAQLA